MFYQLKWFDPALSDAVISSQAGILTASFTAAQFFTALLWGRTADSSRFGRKKVLMIGLGGTSKSRTSQVYVLTVVPRYTNDSPVVVLSCIGYAFSTTFWQALFFRSLGGITNGNVGVMRTM
jgi:MFS family permease